MNPSREISSRISTRPLLYTLLLLFSCIDLALDRQLCSYAGICCSIKWDVRKLWADMKMYSTWEIASSIVQKLLLLLHLNC